MVIRHWIRFCVLTVMTCLLWCSVAVAAAGDPVSCDINANDKTKRALAFEAYNNAARAHNRLQEIVKSLQQDYEAENGVCHYLEGTFGKWWNEATTNQLGYTDAAKAGAKVVKEIANLDCESVIEKTERYEKYTDWDISKLKQRATNGNTEVSGIVEWAKTAKEGQYLAIGSDTKNYICSTVKCKSDTFTNDCDYIVKRGNGLACVDAGSGTSSKFPQKQDDGKCNNGMIVVPCVAEVFDNDIAYSFPSLDNFTKTLTSDSSNAQKCIAKLDNLEKLRGSADDPNSFIGARKIASNSLATLSGQVDSQCFCKSDAAGNATDELIKCTAHDSDFQENNMGDGCLPVDQYLYALQNNCIICKMFASLIGSVQQIAQNAFEKLADTFVKLLGIALLLFLGYTVLTTIASPEQQKLSKFLTSLFVQSAKVAIVVVILQHPTFIYDKIFNPVLEGSIDFSATLMGTNRSTIEEIGKKYAENFNFDNKYVTVSTAQSLTGMVENFGKEMVIMPAIGRSLWCHAWSDLQAYILPHFKMAFIGAVFYIFGIGIWLAVGFYMLDCAVQLGLACALMPFFIACWPFKQTNRYAVTGWNIFINVFFNFMMMGIIISIITALSAQSLSVGRTTEELIKMINDNSVSDLEKTLEIGGLQMVFIVVCCMMCYKLSKESQRLANKFAGGAQIAMGAALGGLAGNTAQSLAIGNMGKKDKNGKRQGAGGALGLAKKGAGAILGSAAEHSGAKGLYNEKKGKLQSGMKKFAGKMGIGSKAQMGTKGRDANANNADNSQPTFAPDDGGDE